MNETVPAWAYDAYTSRLHELEDRLEELPITYTEQARAMLHKAMEPASASQFDERLRTMDPEKRGVFLRMLSVPLEFASEVNPNIARLQKILKNGLNGESPKTES